MIRDITTKRGYTFHVYDSPGKRGTIIAVHGLTGNHQQFHYYQKALAGKYRFISYDVRGRGNSSQASKDSSIHLHADDLIEIIEKMEIERPILIGYSMGAYICAIAASRLSNIAALILLDGGGEADEQSRQLVLPSLKRLQKVYQSKKQYVDEVKDLYINLRINWNDRLADILKYEIKKIAGGWQHKSSSDLIEQDFESFYMFDHKKIYANIKVNTLLVIATGKIGEIAPLFQETAYMKMRERIQQLETEYTIVNHYELVFNEQLDLIEKIEQFLEKQGVK